MEPGTDVRRDPAEAVLRMDSWHAGDGRRAHLMVVSAGWGLSIAHAVVLSADGLDLRVGSEVFGDGATLASRDSLLDLFRLVPATARTLDLAGAFDDDPDRLVARIEKAVRALDRQQGREYGADAAPRLALSLSDAVRRSEAGTLGLHPMGPYAANQGEDPWPGPPLAAPAVDGPDAVLIPVTTGAWGTGSALRAPVLDWCRSVRETACPGILATLGGYAWTPEAFRFVAQGRSLGPNRAQAAALQPAFLPTVARDPDMVAAIDGGEPFEPILLDRILSAYPDLRGAFGPAQLRRLRTYPKTFTASDLRGFLPLLSALPVDLLPRDRSGWERLRTSGMSVLRRLGTGLPLDVLLRGVGPDWDIAKLLPPDEADEPSDPAEAVRRAVVGTNDMVERAVETLVRACLPGRWARRQEAYDLAVGILFQGRDLAGIFALQRRWHERQAAFAQVLRGPVDLPDLTWPALLPETDCGDGIRIRFLTNSTELRDEGAEGPDSAGVPGLAHCVGGYDLRCAEGQVHVASIARILPGGGRERLSTVAFRSPGIQLLEVEQHYGAGNRAPPQPAVEALERLLRALDEGRVRLDQAARGLRRVPEGVRPDPHDAERAFEAWRPYLPRATARGGAEALALAHGFRPAA